MFESVDLAPRPNWTVRFVCGAIALGLIAGVVALLRMTQMPLTSYRGALPPLTLQQRESRDGLALDLEYLASSIGERSMQRSGSLDMTVGFIRKKLESLGYEAKEIRYEIGG